MQQKKIKIVILMGGNLGNVPKCFNFAIKKLIDGGFEFSQKSSILKNPPVDCAPGTPDFYNAALIGYWTKSAAELLSLTQSVEVASGRPLEHGYNTSRNLDLDIILFGDEIISTPHLEIPHPRASQREFVLIPLCEIEPDIIFPDSKKSAKTLLNEINPTKI